MGRFRIDVGKQADGFTFRLHPRSCQRLEGHKHGRVNPATIFIGFDTLEDFQSLHGPIWLQVAQLLTGLGQNQLEGFGGYEFIDPGTGDVLHTGPVGT